MPDPLETRTRSWTRTRGGGATIRRRYDRLGDSRMWLSTMIPPVRVTRMRHGSRLLSNLAAWLVVLFVLTFAPLVWDTFSSRDARKLADYPHYRTQFEKPGILLEVIDEPIEAQPGGVRRTWYCRFGLPFRCANVCAAQTLGPTPSLTANSGILIGSRASDELLSMEGYNIHMPAWMVPLRFEPAAAIANVAASLFLTILLLRLHSRLRGAARSQPRRYARGALLTSAIIAPLSLAATAVVPTVLASSVEFGSEFSACGIEWSRIAMPARSTLVATRVSRDVGSEDDPALNELQPGLVETLTRIPPTGEFRHVDIRLDRLGWPLPFLQGCAVLPSRRSPEVAPICGTAVVWGTATSIETIRLLPLWPIWSSVFFGLGAWTLLNFVVFIMFPEPRLAIFLLREYRRSCIACGYPLAHVDGAGTCPECGAMRPRKLDSEHR